MLIGRKELLAIDKVFFQEDLQRHSVPRANIKGLLAARQTSTSTPADFDNIPLYWCPLIQVALLEMIKEFPQVAFIAVRNINYGVRIYHTSTIMNLNALNKIKLDLANKIDSEILARVIRFYSKKR
jgi:hypothetical protein